MPIVMIVSQFQGAQTLVVDLRVSVALKKNFARLCAHFGHPPISNPGSTPEVVGNWGLRASCQVLKHGWSRVVVRAGT